MKRNRRAGVEDRWTKTVHEPDGTKNVVCHELGTSLT